MIVALLNDAGQAMRVFGRFTPEQAVRFCVAMNARAKGWKYVPFNDGDCPSLSDCGFSCLPNGDTVVVVIKAPDANRLAKWLSSVDDDPIGSLLETYSDDGSQWNECENCGALTDTINCVCGEESNG